LCALGTTAAGCTVALFDDLCDLYGPVGGDGATTVEVYNSAADDVRVTVVPVGAVNPCAERNLPPRTATPDDAFIFGGVSVAVLLFGGLPGNSFDQLVEMPKVGETAARTLDCDRIGGSIIFGPTIWLDTANRRVLAVSGPIPLYRQRGNDLDLSRVYQCGDRIQLEVDEDFTATALIIRNGAAVASEPIDSVTVKQVCTAGDPITPGGTTLLLTWSVRQPAGFDDTTYQLFEQDGAFYLGRVDRFFVTPFAPSPSLIFGSDPRVTLPTDAVQALLATLEENCVFDLPSDLTGRYFYPGDNSSGGTAWYVAVTRGLLENELLIDQTALELDGRYEAIVAALEQFVADHAGG
jgi:hypothetical protein